jgi:hypothetical protein
MCDTQCEGPKTEISYFCIRLVSRIKGACGRKLIADGGVADGGCSQRACDWWI